MTGLVERLRKAAEGAHRAQAWLSKQKTERNQAAGDEHAYYDGGTIEQTIEWQAADRIEALEAAVKEARDTLETLAAQTSGIVGSSARADCMAALANAALQNLIAKLDALSPAGRGDMRTSSEDTGRTS